MVLTVYFALSPATGLVCHRRPQETCKKLASRELDTSVGVSGPHDFAVRAQCHSSFDKPRPSHPAPNVRDDRETPLLWVRDGKRCRSDLGQKRTGIFLRGGLDRRLGELPVGYQACVGLGNWGEMLDRDPHHNGGLMSFAKCGDQRKSRTLMSLHSSACFTSISDSIVKRPRRSQRRHCKRSERAPGTASGECDREQARAKQHEAGCGYREESTGYQVMIAHGTHSCRARGVPVGCSNGTTVTVHSQKDCARVRKLESD